MDGVQDMLKDANNMATQNHNKPPVNNPVPGLMLAAVLIGVVVYYGQSR